MKSAMRTRRSNLDPWRHRIVTAGAKRVTAREALQRQPRATRHAVQTDRLGRVVRTGRDEAAGSGEQRGDEQLVASQKDERDPDGRRERRLRVLVPVGSRAPSARLRIAGTAWDAERFVRGCDGIHVQERSGWCRAVLASGR